MRRWKTWLFRRMRVYAKTWWFPILLAALAAVDAYIFIVPTEALLVPAVLAHRRRWYLMGFWVTLGSALGAASFAWLASRYGTMFVDAVFHGATQSKAWLDSQHFIAEHGWWGLALVSFGPFPQHPAVAIAGLAHMDTLVVLVSVFVGRFVKYELVGWAAAFSPKLLKKLRIT